MILAVHALDVVEEYCTHVLVLKDGRGRVFDDVKLACAIYATVSFDCWSRIDKVHGWYEFDAVDADGALDGGAFHDQADLQLFPRRRHHHR